MNDDDTRRVIKAINERTQICLLYLHKDKPYGLRYGNPYALYVHPSTKNLIIDFWQTGGVSEKGEPIPGWRRYFMVDVSQVSVINHYAKFPIVPGYNEKSKLYDFQCFAKVKL